MRGRMRARGGPAPARESPANRKHFQEKWTAVFPSENAKMQKRLAPARDEFAAMAQAFLVDAVADAGGDVPFRRHPEPRQPVGGMEQRLNRNELVAVAMQQQDRRARFDLGGELFGLRLRRLDQ